MGLNIAKAGKRRTSALLAGTFLMGAVGATLIDDAAWTPAQAQNLSEQVPNVAAQRNAPGFADIVDRVSPAVVSIQVKSRARTQLSGFRGFEGSPFERFFDEFEDRFGDGDRGDNDQRSERFGRRGDQERGRQFSMGQGSGFILSADGYVVTNGHVVSSAEEVDVILQDGTALTAQVVGVDDKTDLALVKVDSQTDLPFVTFATQETKVGDWVMAVGNPFGLGGTVTAGIVSARGREIGAGPYDDFLQIDAPINRGNSGGPTFNLNGNVVGVNTAIYSPSGGSIGIGFAIPASIAQNVISDLRDDGTVTRGWLGVQIQPITPEIAESLGRDDILGALVTEPQSGSPAATAGIRTGDAILSVDGEEVDGPRALARTISTKEPGAAVTLKVWREGREQDIDVTLGTLSNEQEQADNQEESAPSRGGVEDSSQVLGMTLAPASDVGIEGDGLAVVEVDPNGAAAEAGIRVGDIIMQASGIDVASSGDFEDGLDAAKQDGRKNVLLKLQTGENARFVAVPVEDSRG